ncbi:MAG: hypothetical protein RIC55_11680 [Pirellulaceae bacterium]
MRLIRTAALIGLLFGCYVLGEIAANALGQTTPGTNAQQVASLKDTLEKGLKARRPLEFEFIDHVAELTTQGKLPLDVVLSTFQWARPKKPAPFPYFQRAMQIRAAKLGVDLE